MFQFIENHLRASASVKSALAAQAPLINDITQQLIAVSRAGGTIYACGNGGSTCDAMHLTEELLARYKRERPGIRAAHLCDAATLTCWSNDYEFEGVFRRLVETLVNPGDALVCFSTSGNSANILAALKAARAKNALTIGLLGKNGGAARALCKLALVVPSEETALIQEAHSSLIHIICEGLETSLFPTA